MTQGLSADVNLLTTVLMGRDQQEHQQSRLHVAYRKVLFCRSQMPRGQATKRPSLTTRSRPHLCLRMRGRTAWGWARSMLSWRVNWPLLQVSSRSMARTRQLSRHSLQPRSALTPSLPFPSLPFPSLPFPSLPFPSLPFPSLPFPSLPFPSLPFPSLPFPLSSFLSHACFILFALVPVSSPMKE